MEQDQQLHMDGLFIDFCSVMKGEMNRHLGPKQILVGYTSGNKSRQI